MAAHFLEWLQLAARWLHVVAAIAWVGASFYFIWVENALSRGGRQRTDDLAGHLWSVHGGGFYYLEKYKGAPAELPPKLHWFKWEAYTTWLSGVALLALVYYFNAATWLAAPGASSAAAIVVSVALLFGGWLAYDLLCRTPLLGRPRLFAALGLAAGWGLIYWLDAMLSPRAIFLHLGAMMGTAMAGNVLCVIIPSQKRLVAAAKSNIAPDLRLGRRAALRSLHNNYLALPAVILMLTAHYPLVYQHPQSGLLFVALSAAGGFVRHFVNVKNRGTMEWRWLAVAAAAMTAAILLSAPPPTVGGGEKIETADIRPLMARHCVGCHAASPSDPVFRSPPVGLILETEEQINAAAEAVYRRVVVDRSMPLNNATGMTEKERQAVADWWQRLRNRQQ